MQNNHNDDTAIHPWLPADGRPFADGRTSADIAVLFQELADFAHLTGDTYRGKAFMRAAKVFRGKGVPMVITPADIPGLQKLPGIGPGIAARVSEYVSTGTLAELTAAKASPRYKAFIELTGILGVGPKTAAAWIDRGVFSMGDLRRMVGAGSILLTKQQELGIRWYTDLHQRIPRVSVEKIAGDIRGLLGEFVPADRIIVAGSYRRGLPSSGDIDILIRGNYQMVRLTKILAEDPAFIDFISTGDERTTFLWSDGNARQVDILLRPDNAWGAALAYFTGDAGFAKMMRARAKQMGLQLNQNGLFTRGARPRQIPTPTEESVFEKLGMPYTEPAGRSCSR